MRKFSWLIWTVLIFTFPAGCYQEVDLKVPFEGPKMVLEGYLSPGKGLDLEIRRTFDPYVHTDFDEDGYWVTGARVDVYRQGQIIDSCRETEKGRYLSLHPELYRAGEEYEVRVMASDFEEVFVDDIHIPAQSLVKPDEFTFQLTENRDYLNLTASLQNPDHYATYRAKSWHDSRVVNPLDTWISRDQNTTYECDGDRLYYLSNKCEAGPSFEVKFRSELKKRVKFSDFDKVFLPKSYVYFEVGQVDVRYRDYVETANASDEPFIEPKLDPGNAEGGYGFIVGWNPVGFTYKL